MFHHVCPIKLFLIHFSNFFHVQFQTINTYYQHIIKKSIEKKICAFYEQTKRSETSSEKKGLERPLKIFYSCYTPRYYFAVSSISWTWYRCVTGTTHLIYNVDNVKNRTHFILSKESRYAK